MTPQEHLDFAERFVAAIQAGDTDAVRACYAPDAKLWHNSDGIEQTVDQVLGVLHVAGPDIDLGRAGGEEGAHKGLANAAVAARDQGDAVLDFHP
jgi:ketosteroid isomerase-like protein